MNTPGVRTVTGRDAIEWAAATGSQLYRYCPLYPLEGSVPITPDMVPKLANQAAANDFYTKVDTHPNTPWSTQVTSFKLCLAFIRKFGASASLEDARVEDAAFDLLEACNTRHYLDELCLVYPATVGKLAAHVMTLEVV